MSALDKQPGGSHYKDMAIQPIEFITANNLEYRVGNVIKYACRHQNKNGREDIEKAIHYLEMILETDYPTKTQPIKTQNESDSTQNGADKPANEPAKNIQSDDEVVSNQSETPEVFTPWEGGEQPSDSVVEIIIRCGRRRRGYAGDFCWEHRGNSADIIAYRVCYE